jgi:signal peptide peptidase SppA
MTEAAELETEPVAQDGGCARPDSLFGMWAIETHRFEQMFAMAKVADLAALRKEARKAKKQTEKEAAASGIEEPLYGLTQDGLAVIEVSGPMTKYETSFSSLFGGTSTLKTRRAVRAAVRNPEVLGIMVRFDSPGGSVAGTSDLADDIAAANKRKPTYAFAEDLMASAALWAGTQGGKLFANKGAEVGSIGAYGRVYDVSGVYAQKSVKVHVISSAPPLKGAGVEGAEITPAQLAEWEREVKDQADIFVSALAEGRGMTKEEAQQLHTGQVWTASKAKELGLIDDVVSFDEAMRRLRSEAMEVKDLETAKAEREKAVVDLAAEKTKREASEKKALELEARLAKLEGENRSARFAEEAKALGLPSEMAAVLDKVEAAVGAEIYGKVATAFKAKVAQVDAGGAFKEKGTTAAALPSGGTATARLAVLTAERMKEVGAGKLELRDAQAQVFTEHPELYEQYVAEVRVRV